MSETSKRGRAAEYRVAAYFLDQGCEVFWPASEGGRVDLETVSPDGARCRIQVKCAYETVMHGKKFVAVKIGSHARSDGRRNRLYQSGDFDVLAASHRDGRLWLIPIEAVLGKTVIYLETVAPTDRKPRGGWAQYRVR